MTGVNLPQDGQAGLPSPESSRSYWHKEPSKVLLGHRTTERLPPQADVVVVGSGITGAMAARGLKAGWAGEKSVLMLEAREACWGATGRNGGHCQPIIYHPPPHIARFELRTFDLLRSLVADNAIPCDWVSTTGVHAFWTDAAVASAAVRIAALPSDLSDAARLVTDPAELADLGVPGARGAVVQASAASLWPYKLVCWVLEDLVSRFAAGGGFNLQTWTPVTRLQKIEGGSADPTWIVHTARGQVAARHVLLASNGYTSHLLPSFSPLIVPVQGQIAALRPESRTLRHTYVFVGLPSATPTNEDYLIQRPSSTQDRSLIFGGGRTLGAGRGVGVSDDDATDPAVSRFLRSALDEAFGEQDGGTAMDSSFEWTGIMGFSRDGFPWVGNVPATMGGGPGLWVCAGYTGHGMPQTSLAAQAAAEMMGGAEPGDVNLPPEFVVSEARVRLAEAMAPVHVQDLSGVFTV